jgi:hypothetical protein
MREKIKTTIGSLEKYKFYFTMYLEGMDLRIF